MILKKIEGEIHKMITELICIDIMDYWKLFGFSSTGLR